MPPKNDPAAFLKDLLAARWTTLTPPVLAMLRVVLSEALVDRDIRAEFLSRVIAPPIDLAQPILTAMVAEGHLAAPDAALTARTIAALMIGLTMLRLLGDPEVESRSTELPEFLANLLAEGLRPRSREPDNPEVPA